jgi:hypothetical protein
VASSKFHKLNPNLGIKKAYHSTESIMCGIIGILLADENQFVSAVIRCLFWPRRLLKGSQLLDGFLAASFIYIFIHFSNDNSNARVPLGEPNAV